MEFCWYRLEKKLKTHSLLYNLYLLTNKIPIKAKTVQIAQLILISFGTTFASGVSGPKILPPSTSKSGCSLFGLAIAKEINPKKNAPNPNPPIITVYNNEFNLAETKK